MDAGSEQRQTPARSDRRWLRTRHALHEAVLELIEEQPDFDAIHVRDICLRADVARPTFYLHFKDKHELLWSSLEEEFDSLRDAMAPLHGDSLLPDDGRPLTQIVFEYLEKNRAVYRAMFAGAGAAKFQRRFTNHMAAAFRQKHAPLRERAPRTDFSENLVAEHLAGSLLGMIQWWLNESDPPNAARMAESFTRLNAPGVMRSLGLEQMLESLE